MIEYKERRCREGRERTHTNGVLKRKKKGKKELVENGRTQHSEQTTKRHTWRCFHHTHTHTTNTHTHTTNTHTHTQEEK